MTCLVSEQMSETFYKHCDALARYNEQLIEQRVCVGTEHLTRAECLQRWATDVRDSVAEAVVVVKKGSSNTRKGSKATKSSDSSES